MKYFDLPKQTMNELGVAGVFLFGSQAQGLERESSDYDFGILLKNPQILSDYKKKTEIYNSIYDLFSSQIKKLRNIDIVFLQSTDLQIKHHVARDGKLLYIGDQKTVSDFLTSTMEHYADFAPHRKLFHQAILQRIWPPSNSILIPFSGE